MTPFSISEFMHDDALMQAALDGVKQSRDSSILPPQNLIESADNFDIEETLRFLKPSEIRPLKSSETKRISKRIKELDLPRIKGKRILTLAEQREVLIAWDVNESRISGQYNNFIVQNGQKSLVMIIDRSSKNNVAKCEKMRDQLHFDTARVIKEDLLPKLTPIQTINIIINHATAARTWCYLQKAFLKNRSHQEESEFGYNSLKFLDHIRVFRTQCQSDDEYHGEDEDAGAPYRGTIYIIQHGNEDWGTMVDEWRKLATQKFPGLRYILAFGIRPREFQTFDRTGWNPMIRGRFWDFFHLGKLLRVCDGDEKDPMYARLLESWGEVTRIRKKNEFGTLNRRNRNQAPPSRAWVYVTSLRAILTSLRTIKSVWQVYELYSVYERIYGRVIIKSVWQVYGLTV